MLAGRASDTITNQMFEDQILKDMEQYKKPQKAIAYKKIHEV